MSTVHVAQQDPTSMRPDLPIPLAPATSPVGTVARVVLGLREPTFERARKVTVIWAAVTAAVLLASQTIVAARYTSIVLGLVSVAACYVVLRVVALVTLERHQKTFESQWLTEQSVRLRRHPFEVISFRVEATAAMPHTGRQRFDLTDRHDMARLLQRQASEREAQMHSRAHIEFIYKPGEGDDFAVASIRRELRDIEFYMAERWLCRGLIRFPEANYGSRPVPGSSDQWWPGRLTYWFLTGPVRVTAVVAAAPPCMPG